MATPNITPALVLRAKRRAGELLAATITKGGNEPKAQLEPLGIARLDSQRWQAVASIPEERFERHLAEEQIVYVHHFPQIVRQTPPRANVRPTAMLRARLSA
ncbi:MAG: hypothetical protein ACYCZN_04545 [Candidatus Dormibacteria bacterium]